MKSTITVAAKSEVSVRVATNLLQDHVNSLPPPPEPEFKKGDPVWLDNGWVGVVSSVGDEGEVNVCYFDADGKIGGPAYGYQLTRIKL